MEILQIIITALSLLGGTFALIVAMTTHKKLAIKVGAHFLMASGATFLIGYILNAPMIYTLPPHGTSVALPTAVCFLVTGGCVLLLSNCKMDIPPRKR